MRITLAVVLITCLLVSLTPAVWAWESEKPSDDIPINRRVEDSTTDGKASVGIGVHIADYNDNQLTYPSDGDDDVVSLYIMTTANTRKIISYGVDDDYYSWHDNVPQYTTIGEH